MRLMVQGWKTQGLRCPDMEIELTSCCESGGISLIQMPNGTGKTTTLNMLRACLTGEAEAWTNADASNYLTRNKAVESGIFILNLELDGQPLTYELALNRSGKAAKYRTTSPIFGGVVESRREPVELVRFFKPNFVNLFVFDGEFADDLLDGRKAEADHAVDALCQLDLVEDIAYVARTHWDTVTGARTEQGQAQKQNRVNQLRDRLAEMRNHLSEAKVRIEEKKKLFNKLDAEVLAYDSKNQKLMKHKEAANSALAAAQAERDNALTELFSIIRNPIYVSKKIKQSLGALKENLDRAKLPSKASRQFFIELSDNAECVCGRPIGSKEAEAIKRRAENYLGDETTTVINSLKDDIENFVGGSQPDFSAVKIRFKSGQEKFKKAQLEVERIKRAFRDDSLETRNIKERERDAAGVEIDNLEKLVRKLNSPESSPKDDTRSIPALEMLVTQAEDELSDIAGKVELGKQTRLIEELCEAVLNTSREAIKRDLVSRCNDQLVRILVHSPLRLEGISGCLKLEGQDGASVGQVLSVGYTFLTSMLHRSRHDFPLVVDSPANPIDHHVRAEIGGMIPALCHQFIAFTISSEKAGFVSSLEKSVRGRKDFLTVFRKTEKNPKLLLNANKYDHEESFDGCVVRDREYFMDFQLDQESEETL